MNTFSILFHFVLDLLKVWGWLLVVVLIVLFGEKKREVE